MTRIMELDNYELRDIERAIWEYERGEVIECLYFLEKAIPELKDIHRKVTVVDKT